MDYICRIDSCVSADCFADVEYDVFNCENKRGGRREMA